MIFSFKRGDKLQSRVTMVLLALILFGCGSSHDSELVNLSELPEEVQSVDGLAQGKILYANHCASCHGALEFSAKKGASAADISGALDSIQVMVDLKSFLSSEQVNYLALALAIPPPNPIGEFQSVHTRYKSNKGNRRYIASVFKQVFLPKGEQPEQEDLPILIKINAHIEQKTADFGGPCRHTENCEFGIINGLPNLNAQVDVLPGAKTSRMGYRLKACQEILSIDRSVENFALNTGGTLAEQPEATDLARVYDQFYPGRELSSEMQSKMETLLQKAESLQMSSTDQWRFLALPFCENAGLDFL